MSKDLNYYLNLKYKIEIIEDEEEGGFVLSHPELSGCITRADTIEVGLLDLYDVKKRWILTCIEEGKAIPEPNNNSHDFSGQFRLKMPKSLHRDLCFSAEKEGVSLNQYIIYLLSMGLYKQKNNK